MLCTDVSNYRPDDTLLIIHLSLSQYLIGGQALCRALMKNTTLKDVNVGSNEMTEPTAAVLAQVVIHNTKLTHIDLSCNRLGPVSMKFCFPENFQRITEKTYLPSYPSVTIMCGPICGIVA